MQNKTISEGLQGFTKKQKIVLFLLLLLTAGLGIAYPLLLASYSGFAISISRDYRPGELSDEDVISPADFSYVDEVATAESINAAAEGVLPIFSYSLSSSMEMREKLSRLRQAVESSDYSSMPESSAIDKISELERSDAMTIVRLAEECLDTLIMQGIFSSEDLERVMESGYADVSVEDTDVGFAYRGKDVAADSVISDTDVYAYVLDWAGRFYPMLSAGEADLIAGAVDYVASPNVLYDEIMTIAKREEAASSVPPVLVDVSRGDYILKRDTIVTEQQLRTIRMMSENPLLSIPFTMALGYAVFVIVFVLMTIFLLFYFIRYRYRLFLYIVMFLIGSDLILTFNYFFIHLLTDQGIRFVDPYIPIAMLPILATSVTGRRRVGFSIALLLSGLAVIYPTSRSFTFFYLLTSSECCMLFMRQGKERMDMIYQTLFSAFAVAAVTMIVSIIYSLGFQEAVQSVLVSVVNTVTSFMLLSILLPIFEKIFNIPTVYRLHELSYADTPTLNRLSQVAPGTWNHSKNVSEMAYAACKAIDANAELALVGGLYHDIGKAEHPEYFIENQSGKNAHDEINNTLSAAIIKSHVKLGVEKGKEIGLPQEVIDIISEHHGNDLIKYFYNQAVREAEERSLTVSEEDFRYNGRIPSTPESAVVMLADCTEAATRTLKNPNHQKYEKFISSIIMDKMNYKQLNNSRLTLNDLDKIKESFIHYLMGRDHQRIEYGKEK